MGQRGGARPGAGRPRGGRGVIRAIVQKLAVERPTAAMILSQIDENGVWRRHLTSEDSAISLKALVYLTDRRDGKAVEFIKQETVNYNVSDTKQRIIELLAQRTGSGTGDAEGKTEDESAVAGAPGRA